MERKGTSTVAVTAEEIRFALPRSRTVTSEEEKALRMRHGVSADDLRAPLPRADGGNQELADELSLIEMQLLKSFRAHQEKARSAPPRPSEAGGRAKDKIVRALRKKK